MKTQDRAIHRVQIQTVEHWVWGGQSPCLHSSLHRVTKTLVGVHHSPGSSCHPGAVEDDRVGVGVEAIILRSRQSSLIKIRNCLWLHPPSVIQDYQFLIMLLNNRNDWIIVNPVLSHKNLGKMVNPVNQLTSCYDQVTLCLHHHQLQPLLITVRTQRYCHMS